MDMFFLDDTVEIDRNILPSVLKNLYDDLLKYKADKNFPMFIITWESMEALSKQALLDGMIDENTLDNIRQWLGFGD